MGYSLEGQGSFVRLAFGVCEYAARHPENWGWILISTGSFWTGFPMPLLGTDPHVNDDRWREAIVKRDGFQI